MATSSELLLFSIATLLAVGAPESHREHVSAQRDQQHRPVTHDAVHIQQVEIVEQEKTAERDEQYRHDGKLGGRPAQGNQARKLVDGFAGLTLLGRVIRLERHVCPEAGEHQAEERLQVAHGAGLYRELDSGMTRTLLVDRKSTRLNSSH